MSLRRLSGYSSARAPFILFLFILLALTPLVITNALSLNAPTAQRLTRDLLQAHALLQRSSNRLTAQSQNLKDLQRSLKLAAKALADSKTQIDVLRANLAQAGKSQTVLSSRLDRLQATYKRLTGEYSTLSASFAAYRREMQRQVKTLQLSRNIAQRADRIVKSVAIAEGIALVAGILGITIYLRTK